jgi:lysophospholipid acyltransferase (LPLAT)-like uncharacterized protein
VAPSLVAALIRGLERTMRIETVNGEGIAERWRAGHGNIIAFWHGRQLMMARVPYGGRGVDILISRHRDGELISRAMGSFGFSSVRGSTTRGGSVALKALIQRARAGHDLVITPDGPKGPRQIAQPGVIHLAKATGLPIFPMTFGASKKKSCRRGTASCFRTRSHAASFSGANRSGSRATPTPRSVRRAAPPWSAR